LQDFFHIAKTVGPLGKLAAGHWTFNAAACARPG
jgi:hypothetical protein